jgi:hypothetical protein
VRETLLNNNSGITLFSDKLLLKPFEEKEIYVARKSIYTKTNEGKSNEIGQRTSSESLVFSRRDINDMKIFIRFDKLENYSCDGTAFISFVLCLRLFRILIFCASTKVEKSFFAFAFFILFTTTSCFSPSVIVQTRKNGNPRG